jgi:hypothetical protein
MFGSPFRDMAVDEELNVHVLSPGVPQQAELVRINGVRVDEIIAHAQDQEPHWKAYLNALLPGVMQVVGTPLSEVAKVTIKNSLGEEEDLSLTCPVDKSPEHIAAIKDQYASILRLAALSGLTPQDVSCVYSVCMAQAGLDSDAVPEELMHGVQGMAQQMAQGMAGGAAPGGQCQQQ